MRNLYITFSICTLLMASFIARAQDNWYNEANQRIEQLRKGNFGIKLVDGSNNPIADSVTITLIKHEFPWGSPIPELSDADYNWYSTSLTKFFNCGVWGNIFKWPWIEPQKGQTAYTQIDSTLAWANKVGWEMRGHTLLWGGDANWQTPQWILDMTNPQDIWNACKDHIVRDVTRYAGKIKEYDVYNEPVHETWLTTAVGDSILWYSFKWAHEADPNAKLYVNDFNIIEEYSDVDKYKVLIKTMLDNGAPIDGIGVQGHFGGTISWSDIKAKLDTLATLGLPIKVTEFDMDVDKNKLSQQTQATSYARFLRTAFSHPSVNGVMCWGFYDKEAWRAGSGLFDQNKIPKIAADSVYNLIHKEWSTSIADSTQADGTLSFRGFYGKYEVVVKNNGKEKRFIIDAAKANADSVFQLNMAEAQPLQAKIVKATLNNDGTAIELTFSKKIDPKTIKASDFTVLDVLANAVTSAQIKDNDSTILVLTLTKSIIYRQVAEVFNTAYSGTMDADSIDVGVFGPIFIENKLPGFKNAVMLDDRKTIQIQFTEDMAETIPDGSFKVIFNNNTLTAASITRDASTQNTVNIVLSSELAEAGLLQINYTNKGYTSSEGYLLNSFGPKYITLPASLDIKSITGKNLMFYPNPASDNITVISSGEYNNLVIFDAIGKEILKTSITSNNQTVSISDLNAGLYNIVFSNNKGEKKFAKLVKK